MKLQAASGDARGALRVVASGAEFTGPAGADLRKAASLGIASGVMPDDPAAAEVLLAAKQAVADDRGLHNLETLARAEARLGRFADAVASAGQINLTSVHVKFNTAQVFVGIAMEQARAGDQAGAV